MSKRNANSAPAGTPVETSLIGVVSAPIKDSVKTASRKWDDLQTFATAASKDVGLATKATLSDAGKATTGGVATEAGTDSWKSLAGGTAVSPMTDEQLRQAKNIIAQTKSVVELLQTAVAVAEVILQVVNVLQSDVKNWYKPLKITAELLLEQIKEVLVSLASTGLYMLPVLPAGVGLESVVATVKDKVISLGTSTEPSMPSIPLSSALAEVGRQLDAATTKTSDTLGAFNTILNSAAFSTTDPNRPIFDNEGDVVGGAVFFLDAQADIGDLVKDIKVLLKLFGSIVDLDRLKLEAPKDLTATAIMAARDGADTLLNPSASWLNDILTSATMGGSKYPAIQLTWTTEGIAIPSVTGWYIHRTQTPNPPPLFDDKGVPIRDSFGDLIIDYDDPEFNGGKPVFTSDTNYVDFDVEPDNTYYYWVAPATKVGGKKQPSNSVSNTAVATAINCIPVLEKPVVVETPAGFLPGTPTGSPPYWKNITIRDLLGKQIDQLYKNMYLSIQRLFASAETAVDQQNDLIELLKEKLAQLQELLDATGEIIETLYALRLSASSMFLYVSPSAGGMKNFVNRVAKATPPVAKPSVGATTDKDGATATRTDDKPAPGSPCSVYAAIVLVAGWPGAGTVAKLNVMDKNNPIRKSATQQASASVGAFKDHTGRVLDAVQSGVDQIGATSETLVAPGSNQEEQSKTKKSYKLEVDDKAKAALEGILGLFSGMGSGGK